MTGDGRVNWRDIAAASRALRHRNRDTRYDVNRDGRVNLRLLVADLRPARPPLLTDADR